MACIHDKFATSTGKRNISSKQIWEHLQELYNLQALVSSWVWKVLRGLLCFGRSRKNFGKLTRHSIIIYLKNFPFSLNLCFWHKRSKNQCPLWCKSVSEPLWSLLLNLFGLKHVLGAPSNGPLRLTSPTMFCFITEWGLGTTNYCWNIGSGSLCLGLLKWNTKKTFFFTSFIRSFFVCLLWLSMLSKNFILYQ